ncbi:class I SAM-dependent methyltransferase [Pseudolabrys sp. FHR47]|uniref:class I SAM-dependent methyltransferase n=1 Tax=Pseudolabrys sp. FHR47 TaxID=2562284 RepID=UPI0010BEBFA0|nr:class I SAM-dependent methyltransferase [Pseudolabrys sp. FHR47]
MSLREFIKQVIGPRLTHLVRQARMPRFDTDHAKTWWRTRDQTDPGLVEFYWQSRHAPARRAIAEVVKDLDGRSLLEIGCHAGANLWAISQVRSFERLTGTDLSPTVLAEARRRLAAEGQAAELVLASTDALPFADKSVDIALTSVMLVCVGPEAIDASLDEILRVTRRWLVLCEPWSERKGEHPDRHPETTYWIRNYRERLEGRAEMTSVRHLPPEHRIGHLDSIAVFRLRAG